MRAQPAALDTQTAQVACPLTSHLQRGRESLVKGGMMEVKPGFAELPRKNAGAGQQGLVGHFAQGKAEGEGGRRKKGGPVNSMGESLREFAIGDRLWGSEVDGTRKSWRVEGKKHCGNSVFQADPTHPLMAGAETASETEAEEGSEFGKCAGARADDDSEAEMDDADSGIDRWLSGLFPLPADVGQKARTGCRRLVKDLVATIAVDSGCGSHQQGLRRISQTRKRLGQNAGGIDAAGADLLLPLRGPAVAGHVCAAKVDCGGQALKLFRA